MKAPGASTGRPTSVFMDGRPSEYDSVTIRPKTAADMMFSGLSETSLLKRTSIPTATPTPIRAHMTTVRPRLRLSVPVIMLNGVTCDHRAADTTVMPMSAMSV